jgi:hypothetical protein
MHDEGLKGCLPTPLSGLSLDGDFSTRGQGDRLKTVRRERQILRRSLKHWDSLPPSTEVDSREPKSAVMSDCGSLAPSGLLRRPGTVANTVRPLGLLPGELLGQTA